MSTDNRRHPKGKVKPLHHPRRPSSIITDSAFYSGFKLVFVPILEQKYGFWDKDFYPEWQNRDKISLMLKFFCTP